MHHVCGIRLYVIDSENFVTVFEWDGPHPAFLCRHIESYKGQKKSIMKSGNSKLAVYSMQIANKQREMVDST